MTNGVIVALGDVGRNVAAGMSGGILYLYSEAGLARGWRDKNDKKHKNKNVGHCWGRI